MDEGYYRSICQFCHTNCGIIAHRTGDGAISVKGDPDHPMNRGICCPKVSAIPEVIQSDQRLRDPLLKTPTGFKKISWDEALGIAADRLGEIRSKHGPQSLIRCMGAPVSYHCRDGFHQFIGEFGSPNNTGAGNLCMMPRVTAFKAVTGGIRAEPDYDNTRLVLFWAANPLASERFGSYSAYNGMRQIMSKLKERGTRIISIDPYRTRTVRQGDEWVKIKPGSDVALGLAMIHVIIKEALYDKEFVEAFTVGFDSLEEGVRTCSPGWAEPITGIPGEEIADLARAYATTKPAVIYEGNGLDMYTNGVDAVRTVATLISLTGNLDAPGGNVFMPFARQSTLPTDPASREYKLWADRFPVFPEVPFPAVKESLMAGEENRPRAMIAHHCNPVLIQANEKRTREAMEKLDFLVVSDIFPTATTEIADLVLPMASYFESYGYRAYSSVEGGFLALARPFADPPGSARPVFDVEYDLAEKMGLHENYPFRDTVGWIDFMLEPCGASFQKLEKEQILYVTPPVQYRKYEEKGFNTPSGKVELASRTYEAKGYGAVPSYSEPAGEALVEKEMAEKGFTLLGTTRRPALFVHTKLKNIDALSRLYPEPLVWLHPKDASERGIGDGEVVEVTSPQGSISIRSRLSEDTNPGLVWIDFGWGNATDGKANINILTNDAVFDPISGGTPNRLFPCEIKKG